MESADIRVWNNGYESSSVPNEAPGLLVASLADCSSIERTKYASVRYITSGRALYCAQGRQRVLQSGEMLFINAGIEVEFQVGHTISCLGACVTSEIQISQFAALPSVIKLDSNHSHIGLMISTLGKRLIDQHMLQNSISTYHGNRCIENSFVGLITDLVESSTRIDCRKMKTAYGLLEKVHMASNILRHDFTGKLALSDIADQVGLSKYHLLRVFKDVFGQTPIEFRETIRLTRARQQLLYGHSMSSVADASGYADSSSFSKAFKRCFGLSPRRSTSPQALDIDTI